MTHFLLPVATLVLWTFLLWAVLYWRRIPAMNAVSKDTQDFIRDPELMQRIPARARWAADNYNHLHEQPTLFYAVMLVLFVTGQVGSVDLGLAWGYVLLRMVHSLVQITSNRVLVRFSVFVLASLVLLVLTVRCTLGLL